jgi:hypothetical protein
MKAPKSQSKLHVTYGDTPGLVLLELVESDAKGAPCLGVELHPDEVVRVAWALLDILVHLEEREPTA